MRRFESFCRDEKGMVTIEFVLWVPVIMALVAIVIDATTIYAMHMEMWNVARDTARRMVTGSLQSHEQARAYAADAMSLRDAPYCVHTDYEPANDVVRVVIAANAADMDVIGAGSFLYNALTLKGGDMTASVIMRPDPNNFAFDGSDHTIGCV